MDEITRQALLFDFYGSLLTEKQREIYDLYYQQDLSLGEIGEVQGVSRQAVYDLLKRTEESLNHYEQKLELIQKYLAGKEIIKEISQRVKELKDKYGEENTGKIDELLKKLDDSW